MKMLSLCSGIGGADLSASWAGIEIVGQVEIDPFCQAILAKHWPSIKRMGDIKDVQGNEFGEIDIVVGGVPCQPFSCAGKRGGTEDDRHLWPEMLRIVRTCNPTWVVVENVAGFIHMALDIVQFDLEGSGYQSRAFILPACAVGAPHRRERVFIVAYTCSSGWQECNVSTLTEKQRHIAGCNVEDTATRRFQEQQDPSWAHNELDASGTGQSKSRVGRGPHGLSTGMDRPHRWPAGPGESQRSWEPPRTITEKLPDRTKRLKALGNSIVPQQIYPIFDLIVRSEQPN